MLFKKKITQAVAKNQTVVGSGEGIRFAEQGYNAYGIDCGLVTLHRVIIVRNAKYPQPLVLEPKITDKRVEW